MGGDVPVHTVRGGEQHGAAFLGGSNPFIPCGVCLLRGNGKSAAALLPDRYEVREKREGAISAALIKKFFAIVFLIQSQKYYGVYIDNATMLCYNCYKHKSEFIKLSAKERMRQ